MEKLCFVPGIYKQTKKDHSFSIDDDSPKSGEINLITLGFAAQSFAFV